MRLAQDLALVWRKMMGDRKAIAVMWPLARLFYSPPCLFCGHRTTYRERDSVNFEWGDWQLLGPSASYSLCRNCWLNNQINVAAGVRRVSP